jgi:glycosyltransferase involved in cell wall biosynthesis
MPVKTFGIYVAYAPAVDLRSEGLGRHLAEFLKSAEEHGHVRFVIACPSWTRDNLRELLHAFGLRDDSFEILSPASKPAILRLHEAAQTFDRWRKRKKSRGRLRAWISKVVSGAVFRAERIVVASKSLTLVALIAVLAFPIVFIAKFVSFSVQLISILTRLLLRKVSAGRKLSRLVSAGTKVSHATTRPKENSLLVYLYRLMEDAEANSMRRLIDAREDILAWYSPAAFWPHFNQISGPKLTCVPDVVLNDFPVGFSNVGGDRFVDVFRRVQLAIDGGEHFVTYSEDVKWRTLVDRHHIDPNEITVVPHGANRLDDLIVVNGFPDNEQVTDALCGNLFRAALNKAIGIPDAAIYNSGDIRFIFYASQFRPNKNLISLLRAYEFLLKERYVSHKLVLTGNPRVLPEIGQFIKEHNLTNDVLCLHGLSAQQLAACYRLADLAVNPSLSEGGCPFTFTEALSVGTPVVMARIPVTEEVITDPALQEVMLFDPYNWKDMAQRIEWGLQNQQLLLETQRPLYDELAKRTWRNVVDEYVEILDRISSPTTQGART